MIVLITGATAGFGEAFARKFIENGHTVIGTGRRIERLAKLQKEFGSKFFPLALDMTDSPAVDNVINSLPESLRAYFAERLMFYRQRSAGLSRLPYEPNAKR